MAQGSAVAATGRLKLLSLASFGLISGACFFIGYYLLRRYRKATHQKTDDSTEDEFTASSDTPPTAKIADETTEENGGEDKELKEKKEQEKIEKDDPVRQTNASTQHLSVSRTLEATESDQRATHKDRLTGADVTDSFQHDDSAVKAIVGDIALENEPRENKEAITEIGREEKKATTAKITYQKTGSEKRPAEVQTSKNDATVPTKEDSETCTTVRAAQLTGQKPPNTEEIVAKTVEAAINEKPKSGENIGLGKSTAPANGNVEQSGVIKHVNARDAKIEKQSRSEKVLEVKSSESTVQKSSSADRNEKKPARASAEHEATSETTGNAETVNGAAGQKSETLKHIRSTTAVSKEQTSKEIRDAKETETTPGEELSSEREHAKSPETSEEGEDKSEFPRSGKSHIPEPIRRLADDRSYLVLEPITSHTDESKSPIISSTETYETRPVWSEQPGPDESKQSGSGVSNRIPLNVNAASFHPHWSQWVDGAAQNLPSAAKSKNEHITETNTFAGRNIDGSTDGVTSSIGSADGATSSIDTTDSVTSSIGSAAGVTSSIGSAAGMTSSIVSADGVTSSLSNSPGPLVCQTDGHVPNKSLLPLPPLTPPPDTNKQSRRQRDRGIRGSQKQTVTPTEPASEGGGVTVETQARRSRHRWPPLDDKTLDRVEVDTSSQQVSWKTNKKPSSALQSPWSSPDHAVNDATPSGQDRRKIEFEDNFVDPVSTKVHSPTQTVPRDVTKQSSLLNATPDCVLERKPLISEDDDDEDDADDDEEGVKKQFVRRESTKNGNEDIATEQKAEHDSNDEAVKLVEIDENCIGSLIGLTGAKADPDVRLASLRALVNLSWTSEKHSEYPPVLDQLCANIDTDDANLKLESLRVLVNLSKNPAMVPHLLAAKAPSKLLKLLQPETSEDLLVNWLTVLDDILWTSKELCLTFASLPTQQRAASPETLYTGLYGLKNSRILKSRIFVLSRHKSQQVTYLASRIYSCLTS